MSLQHAIEMRHAGAVLQANRALGAYLRGVCAHVPHSYTGRLIGTLSDAANGVVPFEEACAVMAAETRALSDAGIPHEQLQQLREVLIAHGFFVAAEVARDLARKAVLAEVAAKRNETAPNVLVHAVQVALDLGDTALADHLRTWIDESEVPQTYLSLLDAYLDLCCGRDNVRARSRLPLEAVDFQFAELVSGASVVVVGPALLDADRGHEIDAYDLVVRTNYRGVATLPPAAEAGSRTDISYYSAGRGEDMAREEESSYLHDLRFAVLKGVDHLRCEVPSRCAYMPGPAYFSGFPNMVPNAVFDLALFGPARIDVRGANFWLASTAYHPGYVSDMEPRTVLERLASFSAHDLSNQRTCLQNLANAGIVHFDEAGSDVLWMATEEYLEEMQRIYDPYVAAAAAG